MILAETKIILDSHNILLTLHFLVLVNSSITLLSLETIKWAVVPPIDGKVCWGDS